MKKTAQLMAAFALAIGISSLSAKAGTNLLINGSFEAGPLVSSTGWTLDSGSGSVIIDTAPADQAPTSGTQSAQFDPGGSIGSGQIEQTFPTVSGSAYVLQFAVETLDPYDYNDFPEVVVRVTGSNQTLVNTTYYVYSTSPGLSDQFATISNVFLANSSSSTITFYAQDEVILDNVVVTTGSFAKPGKYTGTIKTSVGVSPEGISSFNTQSVVARITPSGGYYTITQPFGDVFTGAFQQNGMLILTSGATVPVAIHGGNVKYAQVLNSYNDNNGDRVTGTAYYNVNKAGK